MRRVTGGNTLPDLAVGKGDVVYYDSPCFDRRGDDVVIHDVLCDAAGMPVKYKGIADEEISDLSFDNPYWHVVSYSKEGQAMIDAVVSTPGVQGYSSPTPDHVVFSMSDPIYDLVCTSQAWSDLVAEHMAVGRGSWEGKEEISLCLPKAVFDEMLRRWPFLLHDQEAVLVLGTPEAQNWRPAKLLYMQASGCAGEEGELGTWLEVTEDVARAQPSWSWYNGRYYAVLENPAEDAETKKERLVEEKLRILDSVMERIYAMTEAERAAYGLYDDWSAWEETKK